MKRVQMGGNTQTEKDVMVLDEVFAENHLVLYNDDVNTFDWVIESLVKICRHNYEQAEQCAYLVHYNGKCAVKEGSYEKLEPMCTALLDRSLSATIE